MFALPSNFEGLGTSILDAIHSDCAVAASKVGGIPEMIIHQKTGLLSEVGDFNTLAENLETLVKDEPPREKLKNAAKIISIKHFLSNLWFKVICKFTEDLIHR